MFNRIPDLTEKQLVSFWQKVNKDSSRNPSLLNPDLYSHVVGNCWEWTAGVRNEKDCYGRVSLNRVMYDAHRVAYKLQHGKDPEELLVCHHCDNPRCVRKEHIYLGDRFQNSHDRRDRDRMNLNPHKGESHYAAAFTEEQVREIFRRYHEEDITCEQLGDEYNVHSLTISRILRGDTWSHLNLTKKGTSNKRTGEKSKNSKLTNTQAAEIFIRRVKNKESASKLGKEFGVSPSVVYAIASRETWRSVTDQIAI